MLKIILMWFLFIPVPILNGILRESWYKAKIGELGANIVGVFVLSSIWILYTFLFFKNQIFEFSNSKLIMTGVLWLFMTLIFEFGMGFAAHRSWDYMLADYNILKGRLWPVFLIIVVFSPYIIKLISRK